MENFLFHFKTGMKYYVPKKNTPSISKFYSPTLMEFSDNKCVVCCSELIKLRHAIQTDWGHRICGDGEGGGFDLLALPAFLPSVISSFFF